MDDVEPAAAMVQDAARLALELRLRGMASEQKTSAADRAAEALIVRRRL